MIGVFFISLVFILFKTIYTKTNFRNNHISHCIVKNYTPHLPHFDKWSFLKCVLCTSWQHLFDFCSPNQQGRQKFLLQLDLK